MFLREPLEQVCREIREGFQFPADWWETRYSDDEGDELAGERRRPSRKR